MSFRSRLLLFFMIIVIVPMIAVALVLFSITADSETGTAARKRLTALARANPAIRRAAAYDTSRRLIAAVGSPDAVAPAVAAPSTGTKRIGLIAVSITTADGYARAVKRLTGLEARVTVSGRLAGSTLAEPPGRAITPHSGDSKISGRQYRGRFAPLSDVVGPPVAVGVFENRDALASSIDDRRLLIGAILAAFLLLALLSSIVVVRALQRQVNKFLEAAQRLAQGDFTRPVPVEGGDEFAALGREFNAMSEQLASKIEEVQRKRGELEETIRRVGEAFAASLDRQEMVNIAVRTAVEACEAEAGRALPIDLRRMKAAHIGEETPELRAALMEAERTAFAIHEGHGADWLAMLDATGDGEGADEPLERKPVRAAVDGVFAMAVPLLARLGRGRSLEQVGVVSIARAGRDFDDAEYDLFAYLTGQAAVSIENVDLHEMVRIQAVTDELTGLYNLRHFHTSLDGEIERSRRFGQPVGLMMLDIDDFKAVNDTYGHQQGDLVLIEVGRVLRALSRDIDEPARYGGEEMAVILPQTDVDGAELLAERMRAAVAGIEIDRLDGGGRLKVTASFGVASLPSNASDKDALIAEADAALYRAKRTGKNRVGRAEPVIAES
jgi:diguanylate cyclase (GGDEF)-like protein